MYGSTHPPGNLLTIRRSAFGVLQKDTNKYIFLEASNQQTESFSNVIGRSMPRGLKKEFRFWIPTIRGISDS